MRKDEPLRRGSGHLCQELPRLDDLPVNFHICQTGIVRQMMPAVGKQFYPMIVELTELIPRCEPVTAVFVQPLVKTLRAELAQSASR